MQDENSLDPKDLIECKLGLTPETIARSKRLTLILKKTNPAALISASLKLTEDLVKHVEAGGKIILINKDGSKQVINFIGINNKS